MTPPPSASPSTSSTAPPLPLHSQGSYYIYKIIGLTLYTTLLSYGLNAQQYGMYKLLSFLIMTPIIKYFTQYRSAFTNRRILALWMFSNIADLCTATWLLYMIPNYYQGTIVFICFPLITAVLLLFFEVLQYLLFDYGHSNQKYTIRLSSNPLDNSLALVICASYYVQSYYIDWNASPKWYSFLVWLGLHYIQDLIFGFGHYYSHRIPALWKNHKLHHVYKRSELTSFANFYAEFTDAWMMNAGFIIGVITSIGVGGDAYYWTLDITSGALLSHNKYVNDRYTCFYFWEYDALCHIFQHTPPSHFHYHHHTYLYTQNGYFSSGGYFSDSFFQKYAPNPRGLVPKSWYDVRGDREE